MGMLEHSKKIILIFKKMVSLSNCHKLECHTSKQIQRNTFFLFENVTHYITVLTYDGISCLISITIHIITTSIDRFRG